MIPVLDLVATLGGLIIPPAADFIKKKFIKAESDTPERTASSLATTKPEVLPDYIRAIVDLTKAKIDEFNRDVYSKPSQWIIDFRAAIRPIGVCMSIAILVMIGAGWLDNIDGIRLSTEAIVSNWFGSRISLSK